ncbi:MAG: type II toxin-antitoxin system RelE/ParE family toxin [Sphingobium sp.]
MRIDWTQSAASDLRRLHSFLEVAAPEAAVRVIRQLVSAPERLLAYPRLGERLDAYEPREVRRLIVGRYEMRYEVIDGAVVILRVWHSREDKR